MAQRTWAPNHIWATVHALTVGTQVRVNPTPSLSASPFSSPIHNKGKKYIQKYLKHQQTKSAKQTKGAF